MVFKWREGHAPLFLEHFRKYQCLWNYKINSYKNRDTRANAIQALIRDLNIEGVTEEDVKLKIKTIRTKYASELAKVKKSTDGSDAFQKVYVPKLFWFQQADEFLNAVCLHRSNSSNLNTENNTPPHSQIENPQNAIGDTEHYQRADIVQCKVEDVFTDDELQVVSLGESEAASAKYPYQTAPDESGAPKCRKRLNKTPIDKAPKQFKSISDEDRTSENEFDLFCRSLAVHLKKMPLERALLCQEKLQSVIVQERLASIVETEPPSSLPIYSSAKTESQSYHPTN